MQNSDEAQLAGHLILLQESYVALEVHITRSRAGDLRLEQYHPEDISVCETHTSYVTTVIVAVPMQQTGVSPSQGMKGGLEVQGVLSKVIVPDFRGCCRPLCDTSVLSAFRAALGAFVRDLRGPWLWRTIQCCRIQREVFASPPATGRCIPCLRH